MAGVHLWRPCIGDRACTIPNEAIEATQGDCLVLTDGDRVPRPDFPATHQALRERGRFLSGDHARLTSDVSHSMTTGDIVFGRHAHRAWLRSQDFPSSWHATNLVPPGPVACVLDTLSPARRRWNGNDASAWKSDLLDINGFDERMCQERGNRELQARMNKAGVRGKQMRFRASVMMFDRALPVAPPDSRAGNLRILEQPRTKQKTWTDFGIWPNRYVPRRDRARRIS